MDVNALISERFKKARSEDNARYFLMIVNKVKANEKNPDEFVAMGERVGSGQPVAVISKKSSSGQFFPEAGGILRADKAERVPTKGPNPVFKAEYYHAYSSDDLCMSAVIQALPPRERGGMWSANVRAFDVDKNALNVTADKLLGGVDQVLLKALKPWEAENVSSVTHDVRNISLWGDKGEARPGFSPFVVLRNGGNVITVYGLGAVKEGEGDNETFRLPTDEEVLSRIQANPDLQRLKQVVADISVDDLKKGMLAVIPGLSINVGRDSLSGSKQDYLRVPEAFNWVNREKLDDEGKPVISAGYRQADVHIKMSRTGRMMVVNAVPSPGGRLTQHIPLTPDEQALAAGVAAQEQADQQASAATGPTESAPQQAQTKNDKAATQQPRQQTPATQRAPEQPQDASISTAYDDAVEAGADSDFGDYQAYADDFAAMEAMNAGTPGFDEEPDVDDLLNDAAQRISNRRGSRPQM